MRIRYCLLAIGVALVSCEVPPSQSSRYDAVAVLGPRTPASWRLWGEPSYRVEWWSYGAHERLDGVVASGESVVVLLPRGEVVAICARAEWGTGGPCRSSASDFRPAGAVLRVGGDVESVRLTFEDGPLALIMARAAAAGADIRAFNWERLRASIDDVGLPDPWDLDTDRIIAAICGRSMRTTYVRSRDLDEVTVDIPPETWLPPSPFADPLTGGTTLLRLPHGLSVFPGKSGRLLIDVDERGRAWVGATSPPC